MELKISELLAEEEKTCWLKYLDEFSIQVRYLPRRELVKISEKATEITWDRKTHNRIDKVDSDRFYSQFVDKAIISWRGLTLKTLSKMFPIKNDGVDPNSEVPFTKENCIELLRNIYDLDSFLQDSILDIQKFDAEAQEAQKKT